MSREKGGFLDAFYNTPVKYVELRATHFGSKSGFLNHLIEEDMKQHPDIVEMTAALESMKE